MVETSNSRTNSLQLDITVIHDENGGNIQPAALTELLTEGCKSWQNGELILCRT